MFTIQILGLAALAIGTFATPITNAESSKPFVIGVTFPKTETAPETTLYLTSTSTASPNLKDGVECRIEPGPLTKMTDGKSVTETVQKLACGPEKKAFTYSAFHTMSPLELVPSDKMNAGWSISQPGDLLQWSATQPNPATKIVETASVIFSRQNKKDPNKVFAEVCTSFKHHESDDAKKQFGEDIINFWQRGRKGLLHLKMIARKGWENKRCSKNSVLDIRGIIHISNTLRLFPRCGDGGSAVYHAKLIRGGMIPREIIWSQLRWRGRFEFRGNITHHKIMKGKTY